MKNKAEDKASIMIVDDEESIRDALTILLEDEYRVLSVESGEKALVELEKSRIDVMILDLYMPGMSGIELLEEIRRRRIQAQVIISTGKGTLESAQDAVRLRAFSYLTKPVRRKELLDVVGKAMDQVCQSAGEERDEAVRNFDHDLLAGLYAASRQLHSTLDFYELVGVIKEVVLNLIGGEAFAVMVHDEQAGVLHAIESRNVNLGEISPIPLGEGVIGRAVIEGSGAYIAPPRARGEIDLADPRVVIPLKVKNMLLGAVAIYTLLTHKEGLTDQDAELCNLLSGTMANALLTAKLYTESPVKPNTFQAFLDLMTGDRR